MAEPFIGEIRMFAGNFAPMGWMFCEGQLLPISENEALFTAIGTTYGGDGESTFALPNLQSRIPISQGTNSFGTYEMGETGGVETVTLSTAQIPSHTHPLTATSNAAGTITNPADQVLVKTAPMNLYTGQPVDTSLSNAAVGPTGGSQPHTNMQPFLAINFIISLFGIFPSAT